MDHSPCHATVVQILQWPVTQLRYYVILYSAHQQHWKYSNQIIDTLIHDEHFIHLFFKKLR